MTEKKIVVSGTSRTAGALDSNQKNSTWAETPKWLKIIIYIAGPVLALLSIYAIFTAVIVLLGIPIPGFPPNVGSADGQGTGEVGDTFGGLLGPVLTAAALGATVWFSHTQVSQARHQFNEEKLNAERSRAENVTAWVAETVDDPGAEFWRGVLIVNESGSPLRNVDLIIVAEATGNRIADYNREAIVPPGTWFIPFQQRDANLTWMNEWFKPLPVTVEGGMSVRIVSPRLNATESTTQLNGSLQTSTRRHDLTAHTPLKEDTDQTQGFDAQYLSIDEMRYTLHGKTWWRDRDASVHEREIDQKGRKWQWLTEVELNDKARARRYVMGTSARPLSSGLKSVEDIVRTILSDTTPRVVGDRIQQGYGNPLPADKGRLEGVAFIELVDGKEKYKSKMVDSTTLRLLLNGGGYLEISKSKNYYPGQVKLYGYDSEKQTEDSRTGGVGRTPGGRSLVLRAGAKVLESRLNRGCDHKGELDPEAVVKQDKEFWMHHEADLFAVLQAIVDEARRIIKKYPEGKEIVDKNEASTAACRENSEVVD